MSVLFGCRGLSYCRRKVLNLANLPAPLSNSARTVCEMSADGAKECQFDVEHDYKESEFFIKLGEGSPLFLVSFQDCKIYDTMQSGVLAHLRTKSLFIRWCKHC